MTKSWKKFVISVLSLMVVMFGTSVLFNSLPVDQARANSDGCDPSHKVGICHKTGGKWEYRDICVAEMGVVKGHANHGDIIPPFDCPDIGGGNPVIEPCPFPGQGDQTILDNDCVIPDPSPTPTYTPTPTPVVVECEIESWTCEECQTKLSREDICYWDFKSYCGDEFGCSWDDGWFCEDTCEEPGPTNTPTPTDETPTPTDTPVPGEATPTYTPTPTPTPGPGNGGDDGGGNPGPAVCTDTKPGTPSNLRGSWLGSTQVKLDWDHASDPHTSYLVAYGPSENDFPWGNPDIGNDNTYTVGSLTPGAQYCFYVQAQNGCMPGDRSNVFCTNQGSTVPIVLGASDNYNPLVDGMKESYGGVILGETTDLMDTAEVEYSADKLPSGNKPDEGHKIAIPKIGLEENVYLPQKIGDELTVGHQEVLSTDLDGSQVYYGHNAGDVFGKLYTVRAGDKIEVEKDGEILNYQVSRTDFVAETEVEAVKAGEGEIVLMTCSYEKPDHRILVIAKLID